MIITDKEQLLQKCEPCTSIKEGEEIGKQLIEEINNSEYSAAGLAANQIGINKRVCVLNVKELVVLINPEIIERSEDMFGFMEGCLSFPGETIKTKRHKWVKVKADNHEQILYFSVWNEDNESGYNENDKLIYAFETACVQHEIDHLDGIIMYDRELILKPAKRDVPKIGRNQKVTIKKDGEVKVIKWKKAEKLLKEGWKLSDVQLQTH